MRQTSVTTPFAVTGLAVVIGLIIYSWNEPERTAPSIGDRVASRFSAAITSLEIEQARRLQSENAEKIANLEVVKENLQPDPMAQLAIEVGPIELTGTEGEEPKAAVVQEAPPPLQGDVAMVLNRGATLAGALIQAGADKSNTSSAIRAIGRVHNLRRLRAGQKFELTFQPAAKPGQPSILSKVMFRIDPQRSIVAKRDTRGNFTAQTVTEPLNLQVAKAGGVVVGSIYTSLQKASVPRDTAADLLRVFAYDIDFQRDLRRGDKFDVLFEKFFTKSGEFARNGEILMARLTVRGKEHRLYRYKSLDGSIDYYDARGISAQKSLMRTPISGAKLTSRFGFRRHPILGYSKMHQGVDFAAPVGTPVHAAGDGVIEQGGWWGAYGNYIRVKHNKDYSTAYAHLSSLARGIRKGVRVRQGQLIGYVGTTGRSTGPHLHYEVMVRGKQVNPMNVTMKNFRQLGGKDAARFASLRRDLDAKLPNNLVKSDKVASN